MGTTMGSLDRMAPVQRSVVGIALSTTAWSWMMDSLMTSAMGTMEEDDGSIRAARDTSIVTRPSRRPTVRLCSVRCLAEFCGWSMVHCSKYSESTARIQSLHFPFFRMIVITSTLSRYRHTPLHISHVLKINMRITLRTNQVHLGVGRNDRQPRYTRSLQALPPSRRSVSLN